MKFVLAAAVVALTSLSLPVAAKPCDENASEAMKRPGGYCEILLGNQSLSETSSSQQTAQNSGQNSGGYNQPLTGKGGASVF